MSLGNRSGGEKKIKIDVKLKAGGDDDFFYFIGKYSESCTIRIIENLLTFVQFTIVPFLVTESFVD